MDQPGQRGANYIMLGNGRFSPRYGVSCNYNAIAAFLPSCMLCHDTNVVLTDHPVGTVELMADITCPECLNWNEFADSGMALFSPPPNYPQELVLRNKMLKAKFVEYEELTSHVKKYHNNISTGQW
jgi:hypothetical protein